MDEDDRVYLTGRQTWEKHPDGKGGYRPIDAAQRGSIEKPCPYCQKPLIREGNPALIRRTVFGCGQCGHKFVGPDVALASSPST